MRALGFHFNIHTRSNGKPLDEYHTLAKDAFAPTAMAAGERVLLPLQYGAFTRILSGGEPKRSALSDAAAVSFSVDLAVYSDWRVAGPDVMRLLVIRIANMHAKSDSEYKRRTQRHAELLLSMLQPGDAVSRLATNYCASAKSVFEATAALDR